MTTRKTLEETLHEDPATINDVIEVLGKLLADLEVNREAWENPTLERYLEAMQAWLTAFKHRVGPEPSWRLVVEMLEAARIYE
jgi:hypothetical protein